ncbi:hypothetical protein H1D32_05240 [Anaerobacillus sp. CMMVII]|uniref:hypothetical protein n=1 Tax=Anaerobacillus sp. CMMVII TaxID=2755588 RepID=UPI0021B83432|nr:hypothetical protein [Anaerobacillus sp. CMMVII]MCT8137198.1 hypothetical protein [Anaerobacillus sp. CMMVII]
MFKRKKNQYPFIVLSFIHISMLIYTLSKGKDRKRLVSLLLSNIGMAYLFEYIVFNLFQSYIYKPKLLKNKNFDNLLGAIFSQAIFVPITALFITSFKLGWKVKLLFGLYFTLIEKFFIFLGIFNTNWWRTTFTATLIPLYFTLSDFWDKHLQKKTPIVLFISVFKALVVLNSTFLFILAVFRKLRFGLGFFHSWREHFILAPIYTIIVAFFTTCMIEKHNFIKILSLRILLDFFLKRSRILKSNLPIMLELVLHITMLFVAKGLRKLIYGNRND